MNQCTRIAHEKKQNPCYCKISWIVFQKKTWYVFFLFGGFAYGQLILGDEICLGQWVFSINICNEYLGKKKEGPEESI